MKYVFITGGVVSGLGKGITAAALGRLLINRGLRVTIQKLDPFLNADSEKMNPFETGEVFVTEDGTACDLDLGHYERFMDVNMTGANNHTMGQIFRSIAERERAGEYEGKTIQIVPHVTDEIKRVMRGVAGDHDIVMIEVGGTVGDVESMAYLESIRQFRRELGPHNSVFVHVTLVPFLESSHEIKTKPTQQSIHELTTLGIVPDILVCRTGHDVVLDHDTRDKIAAFANLDGPRYVIHNHDCASMYEVPQMLKDQGLDEIVLDKLKIVATSDSLHEWQQMAEKLVKLPKNLTVAIVGKYHVPDTYLSIIEAVKHAGLACGVGVAIKLVDYKEIEHNGIKEAIGKVDGIILSSGFDKFGFVGKIATAEYARTKKIPFLGIRLGFHVAAVEFAQHVLKMPEADSVRVRPDTPHPITVRTPTRRLGVGNVELKPKTLASQLYKTDNAQERHHTTFEVNRDYIDKFEAAGFVVSGTNAELGTIELMEYRNHPFYIGTQFHPEFHSRPFKPHPLFIGFIKAVKGK